MSRIGSTIRSAKMNAITPPKLMPPFQSTAASGMFPTEQTNEMIATSGPTSGPPSFASSGCSTRKNDCQKSSGIQAARAPAIDEPPAHEHDHDDAQLEDEIGGRQLERHGGGEVRALAEDRTGERDGGIGTAGGGGAEAERDHDRARPIVGQKPAHLAMRDHRLH